jgi:hypothetical protein
MHEFAVILIFDVDDTPTVLAATNGLAINDDVALGPNDGERNNVLSTNEIMNGTGKETTYPDRLVQLNFLVVTFVRIKRIQTDVVINELLANLQAPNVKPYTSRSSSNETHLQLERNPLIERQAVGLGDDWNNVHDLAEFLHDNNVDGSE